jgi:ribosome-associated protein YbcJ (S4-like RNA binding protein)
MQNVISIHTEFITLGQALKLSRIILNGGESKDFINNNEIWVNDELEKRRGRKLYPNDILKINNYIYTITKNHGK